MPNVIESLAEWQSIRKNLLKNTADIGFVPTMGNLHAGHISLLQRSQRENALTVLSVFVNPTQFNDVNDLKKYPRTLEQDLLIAKDCGVDYILMPRDDEMYPDRYTYKIINTITHTQEAAFRPGHFDGVLTIVLKLLLLIKPTRAYFGEKDYQQWQLVKGLANAFFLETEIVGCDIVRNEFGLPLSSRNHRLSEAQYELARDFSKIFHSRVTCDKIKEALTQRGLCVDYVEECNGRRFAAVRIGDIRLIDNFVLPEDNQSC